VDRPDPGGYFHGNLEPDTVFTPKLSDSQGQKGREFLCTRDG